MQQDDRDRILDALRATLDDTRLSRAESTGLRRLAAELVEDGEALTFLRTAAFALASQHVEASPVDVVRWLERVDGILERAARPADEAPVHRVAFSPGDDCRRLVRETLRQAQRSLDVCVFTITDDRITKTLLDLHGRGVRVRVVTDDEKQDDRGSDVAALARGGVEVRTDATAAHMHHKFAVVDDRWLVNGSFNWTRSAGANHENVHVTDERLVVGPYREEFERLWRALGG